MSFNFGPSGGGAAVSPAPSGGQTSGMPLSTAASASAASRVSPSAAPKPVASDRRIGDILIDNQSVTPQQLQQALSEARATGKPVGSVLVTLGYVTEQQLGKALAEKHGIEYVDLSEVTVDPSLLKLLPENFATNNLVVPLELDPKKRLLTIAVARPEQIKLLESVVVLTGYHFVPKIGTHSGIVNCLNRLAKDNRASSEELLAQLDEELTKKDSIYGKDDSDSALQAELASESTPLVQLVNSLLIKAIDANASDIHIEPQQERLLVRLRINGILYETESFPKKLSGPLVSRIKVSSGMDIAERRRPQDGRMKLKVGVQEVDMRVNTLAVMYGEKVVIRILKANATSGGLAKLGLPEFILPQIHKMIHAPNGIVLVTGPTGSGKTTTLYSCLREINTPDRNISTIEDPVEYPIAGINQTQISQKAGLTFASCLRALLRQDPDVILVGEVRDEETLEAAIHAALTGHLVFSTIHTNSTAKTIARLLEMGAPNYMITSAVIGIVAQRLVRTLCPHCRKPYSPEEQELAIFGQLPKNFGGSELVFYKGEGCEKCGQSGYSGRVGLYELMTMTREVIDLIDRNASALAIQDEAVNQGMKTLCMDGKEKILAGLTSLEEVTRVLGMDLSV